MLLLDTKRTKDDDDFSDQESSGFDSGSSIDDDYSYDSGGSDSKDSLLF